MLWIGTVLSGTFRVDAARPVEYSLVGRVGSGPVWAKTGRVVVYEKMTRLQLWSHNTCKVFAEVFPRNALR